MIRFTRLSLSISLSLLIALSACGEEDKRAPQTVDAGLEPDATIECVLESNDCPNACSFGTGVLGERCLDSASCGCGLFCSEGTCAPYEGDHRGCACKEGEAPQALPFTERCDEASEGAPCNDLNPCTLDDRCDSGACVGEPTPYPAACDDGNTCTSNDVCAGAVCQGQERPDGARCDDGDLCSSEDTCEAGVCVGQEVSCEGSEDQCNLGVCDPLSGECLAQPKPLGTPCDDGNYCTRNDACEAGICASSARVDCSEQSTECMSATCDPQSGACQLSPREDGLFCDSDESACTQERCVEGRCVIEREVRCDELCRDGVCDPNTGLCSGEPLADGTACDDQDACTQNNTCRGGVCFIEALLCACDELDEGERCDDGNPCTIESRCNADGECLALGFEPEGEPCEADGDLCTQGGRCDGQGECVEESPVTCENELAELELGPCQTLRCQGARGGVCEIVTLDDGVACETGALCDEVGSCQAGHCVAPPKDCSALSDPCAEGACEPSTGECVRHVFPAGSPCEDGDLCTGAGRCSVDDAGATRCTSSEGSADLCDTCAGQAEGASCDDGDLCTEGDRCARRGSILVCLGQPITCELSDPLGACQGAVCDPTTGECSALDLPTGARCNDGEACTINDRCAPSPEDASVARCIGQDLNSAELSCPEGGAPLLNVSRVASPNLVDACTPALEGLSPSSAHSVEALSPSDSQARLLSELSLEVPDEWFSISLGDHEHLTVYVTDRCGLPLPLSVGLFNASATRDLTSSQRPESLEQVDRLVISAPQAGVYLIRASLIQAVEGERLPYVLHVERAPSARCETDLDCCDEERCELSDEGAGEPARLCEPRASFEEEPNDDSGHATRLLFLNTTRARRTGSLSDRFEEDWYKVRLEAGHSYDISTSSVCGRSQDTQLSLYDAEDALPLATNDNRTDALAVSVPLTSLLSAFIPQETADFYVQVSASPNASEAPFGDYTLTVDDVSCAPSELEEACACDAQRCLPIEGLSDVGQCLPSFGEREPNQSPEEARVSGNVMLLDTPTYGQLSRVGDRDTFLIELPAGRFEIETYSYCGQLPVNTALRLKTLAGLTVAENLDGGEGRLSKLIDVVSPSTQGYVLEVRAEGGDVGPYLVEVKTLELNEDTGPQEGRCEQDSDCGCAELQCAPNALGELTCQARHPEVEPNDLRQQATPIELEAGVSGALERLDDVDLYSFTLSSEQLGAYYQVHVEPPCSGLGLEVNARLLDAEGAELVVGEGWRDGLLSATEPILLTRSGRYYVELSGQLASRGAYTLRVSEVTPELYTPLHERSCERHADCLCGALRCDAALNRVGSCVPQGAIELEPNDLPEEARTLAFDELGIAELTGALSAGDDRDQYLIDINAERVWTRLDLSLHNLCDQPSLPISALKLWSPEGILVHEAQGTEESPLPEITRWMATSEGSYRLEVSYAEGVSVSTHQTYRLRVSSEAGCLLPDEGEEPPVGGPCGCALLTCRDATAETEGYCDLSDELLTAQELEPNDLMTLATRLNSREAPFRGVTRYARLDQLGDIDRYAFYTQSEQRGALFSLEVSGVCGGPELPLTSSLVRSDDLAPVLTEGSMFRVDGPARHVITLTLDGQSESLNTGEYLLEVAPVRCEVDADCLCEDVACDTLEGLCVANTIEGEPDNNTHVGADLIPFAPPVNRVSQRRISGFLQAPQGGEIDLDHWRFTVDSASEGSPVTLTFSGQPFCEATLPELTFALSEVVDPTGLSTLTPVTLELIEPEVEGASPSYRASLTTAGSYDLRVSSLSGIGPYVLTLELTHSGSAVGGF